MKKSKYELNLIKRAENELKEGDELKFIIAHLIVQDMHTNGYSVMHLLEHLDESQYTFDSLLKAADLVLNENFSLLSTPSLILE